MTEKSSMAKVADTIHKCNEAVAKKRALDLKLLDESIMEWENKQDAKFSEDFTLGMRGCPLCLVYNRVENETPTCKGCPVRDFTGQDFCKETPYSIALAAYENWKYFNNKSGWHKAAELEIQFLKTVRERVKG